MSVDRDYNIRVKISTDNSGAEDAKTALNKVGAASKETGETGEKSAEGMFEKHHELHKLLHAIGNDAIPGMGHAFADLASGPLGAVTAIALVVELVKRNIEETNQKLDELAATASRAFGGSDALTDMATAAEEAATATDNLGEAMRKAADAGDPIKNKYDAETKAVKAATEAIKEKLKAEEDAAVIDARKHGATEEELEALRARYESRTSATDTAANNAMRVALQRELDERTRNEARLADAAAEAQTPPSVIAGRAQRQSELKATEDALGKAMSEMNTAANDELKEKIEGNRQALERSRKIYGSSDPLGLMKNMQEETDRMESETAENRAARAKERLAELSNQVINDQTRAAEEKSAQESATTAATENTKRIVDLQKEIAEANTASKIKTESSAELLRNVAGYGDTKTFEKAAGVDTPGGMIDFVFQFQQARMRLQNRQGTNADQQTVQLMNQMLASTQGADRATHDTLQAAVNLVIAHKQNTEQQMQQLKAELIRMINSKGK